MINVRQIVFRKKANGLVSWIAWKCFPMISWMMVENSLRRRHENLFEIYARYDNLYLHKQASAREIWWVLFSCPDAPPGPGSLNYGKVTGRPAAPLLWKSAKLTGRGSWGSGAKPKHMKKRRGKYPSRPRHICPEWTKAHEKPWYVRYFPCVFACSGKISDWNIKKQAEIIQR